MVTLDAVFPKDPFSAYLDITTAVVVPCGGPRKSPRKRLCLHFLVIWDCRVQLTLGNRVALNPGLGGVRDVASAIISYEQTQSEYRIQDIKFIYSRLKYLTDEH